ncbi:hypothetical protein [uncultured Maricaulis sp.]|uniref:hypothetical protein n=1 Tax=uncultured Maricaulis sp. TaxID=174710 RepID=UPI002611C838|nr:hypothetical protein [uncultured Maricaulis sp.]
MLISSLLLATALQASPVDTLVANALQVSTAQGSYITYFEADGTYTTNIGISGTWWVDGNELCVERSTGEGGCAPLGDAEEVGSSWTGENAATGEMVTYTIVARD